MDSAEVQVQFDGGPLSTVVAACGRWGCGGGTASGLGSPDTLCWGESCGLVAESVRHGMAETVVAVHRYLLPQ